MYMCVRVILIIQALLIQYVSSKPPTTINLTIHYTLYTAHVSPYTCIPVFTIHTVWYASYLTIVVTVLEQRVKVRLTAHRPVLGVIDRDVTGCDGRVVER